MNADFFIFIDENINNPLAMGQTRIVSEIFQHTSDTLANPAPLGGL